MCNTPWVPLRVWILDSWFNSSCLRIPSDSFFPKSYFTVAVKEIGHRWIRVFKLCLDHPTPESSQECLVTVIPQTDKPPPICFLQHLKYFRSFSLRHLKIYKSSEIFCFLNKLYKIIRIHCSFYYLKDLLCFSESNSFYPWCQEWSLCARADFMSIRFFFNKLENINT